MKAIREKHETPSMFPLILMYKKLRKPLYGSKNKPFHFHDWNEITFIHSGQGSFFVNDHFFEFQSGDTLVIPGNSIHRGIAQPNSNYFASVILFSSSLINSTNVGDSYSYLDLFHLSTQTNNYQIRLDSKLKGEMEDILEKMNLELNTTQSGYRLSVLNLLHQIVLNLLRAQNDADFTLMQKQSKSKKCLWMMEMIKYIDDHLDEKLSLNLLAEQALVSPAHFSRVFKKMTGFNLPEYLNVKRILYAKEKLLKTNSTIAYIAHECGFDSISHFHRVFKIHVGMTPGAYREHGGNHTD